MTTTISTTTSTGVTLTDTRTNPITVTGTITASTGTALYGQGGGTNSWTITSSGLISSTDITAGGLSLGSDVSPVASGLVTNESTGTISGDAFGVAINSNGSVVNTGAISSSTDGVLLGSVTTPSPAAGSVTNLAGGTISGQSTGVYVGGSGALTNQSGATISGTSLAAIYIDGSGNVDNAGILSGSNGVRVSGVGSVTNTAGGTITGNINSGIYLYSPGTVVNAGLLSASSVGVLLENGGTIDNLPGGTISGSSLGVYLGYTATGATFTNAGTVLALDTGANAVIFNAGASSDNRLIVDPGAVFVGNIKGGHGVAELATGAGSGTLYGFGTTITNFSTLLVDSGANWRIAGTLRGSLTDIDNQGTIAVDSSNTLNVSAAVSASSGSGTIEAGSGGIVSIGTVAVNADQTFSFADNTGILELAQPSSFGAPIGNITIGNTIDLTSITADGATWAAGVLTVSSSGTAVATLSMPGNYSAFVFGVSGDGSAGSDITVTATCYAAGTRILTPSGEVPIELLHSGDQVLTVSGKAQPIRWIGHRVVDFRSHPNRQRVLPVRIAAHAFGPGRPKRDLLLSPDHAVFVEGVLIPIRHLINGSNVTQLERQTITYFHIELPRHDVLLADGMPAESYLDAGARSAFANGDDVMQLHPEFTPPQDYYSTLWEQYGCAPLVVAGEVLERIRYMLDDNRYAA